MKSADKRFEYCDKHGEPLPEGSTLDDAEIFRFGCRSQHHGQSEFEGTPCHIPVATGPKQPGAWQISGTVDKPTIAPSINCADCWHGFIENGVFVNCSKVPEEKQ